MHRPVVPLLKTICTKACPSKCLVFNFLPSQAAACVTLNTEAFAKAIDQLSSLGGGRLEVPAGIWFTGPIGLQSHIELHLDKDAVIVFSTDQSLYPIIDTNFEGLDVRRCLSPLHAEGATDIAITGKGVIDGNGDAWREVKRRKVGDDTWKTILKRGGVLSEDGSVWYPDEGYMAARPEPGRAVDQNLPAPGNAQFPQLRAGATGGGDFSEFPLLEPASSLV